MSLLAALDHHYGCSLEQSVEVEYRLVSWGEIFPPFLGAREHSTGARFILREFPFKLFSVSIPHSGRPQKLCLTFHAPLQTRESGNIHSIDLCQDQIAKEFAAFLSLTTRRRVFAARETRRGGLPTEQSAYIYERSHPQERQALREIEPLQIYTLLQSLQAMDRRIARSFVLAMRLYHSAVEMMYAEPEFAYVFLVMSVEAISSAVYHDFRPSEEGEGRTELDHFLDSQYPDWRKLCDTSTPERKDLVFDMLLTPAYFVGRKFRDFIRENLPEHFWSETEDDAKPDYMNIVVGAGPDGRGREYVSHADLTIRDRERIDRNVLPRTLNNVYAARSKLIHEGVRLPASIVMGHYRMLPREAVEEAMAELLQSSGLGASPPLPMPPLITFERLVSYSMVEFLRKQSPGQPPVAADKDRHLKKTEKDQSAD